MPWLNDLPSERLEREFSCFASYLDMLEEMEWKVVWRQIMAYLQVGGGFSLVLGIEDGCLPLPVFIQASTPASLPCHVCTCPPCRVLCSES